MEIKQLQFSSSLRFFEDGFRKRWPSFGHYEDPQAPCLFVGAYKKDLDTINNHKGERYILFGGADFLYAKEIKDFTPITTEFLFENHLKQFIPKPKHFIAIPFKDYSGFKSAPLGDRIYCYIVSQSKNEYYGIDLITEIDKQFPGSLIIGYNFHPMEYVIEHFYRHSFINLQLNPLAGFTTALEMAHMGRKSISNRQTTFCLPFINENDIFKQIELESRKIGSYQENVSESAKQFIYQKDDWIDTDFWK